MPASPFEHGGDTIEVRTNYCNSLIVPHRMAFCNARAGVGWEFCESVLSSFVTKKGQNKGAVTIEDVDDLYQLISMAKGGQRVNVCKIPNSLFTSVRQQLTAYLNAERVYVPWGKWCPEPTSTIQPHWPRRGSPAFPPSFLNAKGSNHYKQVLASVLIALTQ